MERRAEVRVSPAAVVQESSMLMPYWWTQEKPFMVVDGDGLNTYATFDLAEQCAREIRTQVWTVDMATGDEVRAVALDEK